MSILCVGVDPGLANVGIAAVERLDDGTLRSRGVKVVRTEKNDNKAFSNMRAAWDDERRVREHWTAITAAILKLKPQVIAVEVYTVYQPPAIGGLKDAAAGLLGLVPAGTPVEYLANLGTDRDLGMSFLTKLANVADALKGQLQGGVGLGQAAKTILVYGVTLGAAFQAGVPVYPFQPADLKRAFGGRKGASKDDVGQGLYAIVQGLQTQVETSVPQKSLREHATDAAGHAVLGIREYVQLRLDHQQPLNPNA